MIIDIIISSKALVISTIIQLNCTWSLDTFLPLIDIDGQLDAVELTSGCVGSPVDLSMWTDICEQCDEGAASAADSVVAVTVVAVGFQQVRGSDGTLWLTRLLTVSTIWDRLSVVCLLL